MSYSGKIYWHDGLMLLPHHFQVLQKEVLDGFSFQNKHHSDYHYGLIDMSLDHVMLEDGFLSLKSFKAIMPSGLAVDISQNAEVAPYNIKSTAKKDSYIVYIGLPLWQPNSPNTTDSDDKSYNTRRMYKLFETTSSNEDTGEDSSELMLRKFNLRLFLGDDDMSNYDVMPIIKIEKTVKKSSHIKVVMDKEYVPSVLNMGVSAKLKEMAYSLASTIILSAKKSKEKLHGTTMFTETPEKQIKSMFRLNALNECGVKLNTQLNCPSTTPYEVYLTLRKTLANLGAVLPEIDPFELGEYDHDNILESFSRATSALRRALQIEVDRQMYTEHNFESIDDYTLSVNLTPDLLSESTSYFIGVETKLNIKELVSIFEGGDSFKILPPSLCTGMAVPGVRLTYQHVPSELLPRKPGLYYFMIENSSSDKVWQKIVDEKEISAVGPMELLNQLELKLYTIVG